MIIASAASSNDNACADRGNSGELHKLCKAPIVLCSSILTTVVVKKMNIKHKQSNIILHYFNKNILLVFHAKSFWVKCTYNCKTYNHLRCRNIRTIFPLQQSTATPVYSFRMGVPTCKESNKFEKIRNIFRADCTMLCSWNITKIHILYCNHKNISTARSFFLSTTWSHSSQAVQHDVPLIATHMNDN